MRGVILDPRDLSGIVVPSLSRPSIAQRIESVGDAIEVLREQVRVPGQREPCVGVTQD